MKQNKTLTLGSLFDGSGGFPLGGMLAGIEPVWASEIEPFPIRVTTKRLPFMKHYGDVSKMNGAELEPVDIVTFGSPCQDMSIAGRRNGLDGDRSSLFYEAIRIIKEMRCATNGKYPRWICWENVPGAFSSNGGNDFKAVLEAVLSVVEDGVEVPMPEKNKWPSADIYMGDGWSIAYRVCDAQWFGLAQRRKRIFLVADFADRCAGKVLFKSEGLSGYSAEGFRAWQRAARSSEDCLGATGFDGYNGDLTGEVSATLGVNCGMSTGRNGIVLNDQGGNRMDITDEVTCTLRAEAHHPPCVMEAAGFCTEHSATIAVENHPTDSRIKLSPDDKVQTLTSRMGTGGMNVPLLLKIDSGNGHFLTTPKAYGVCSKDSNAMKSDNPHSGFYEADTARTLDGNGGNPSCNQGGIAVVESYAIQGSMIGRTDKNGPQGDGINEEVSFTLNTADRHAVYTITTGSYLQTAEDQAPTLLARDYKDPTAVAYGIGQDAFNQGKNAQFQPTIAEEISPTIVAKRPGAVASDVGQPQYTVRRLTPTECARLQGFPDWWCADLGTENPSAEEVQFWTEIFEIHRKITGTSSKPKTEKQIVKWLRQPHSDAAEYKMWGNGVALPCVFFVLAGIVLYTQSEAL